MRKRTLGGVLIAGLALSGAGAFTASNTFSNTSNVAGYGQMTATGVVVTNLVYTPLSTDASKLDTVKFVTSTDVSAAAYTAKMVLKLGTAFVAQSAACTKGTYALGTMDITCTAPAGTAIDAFDKTGLTVTQ